MFDNGHKGSRNTDCFPIKIHSSVWANPTNPYITTRKGITSIVIHYSSAMTRQIFFLGFPIQILHILFKINLFKEPCCHLTS